MVSRSSGHMGSATAGGEDILDDNTGYHVSLWDNHMLERPGNMGDSKRGLYPRRVAHPDQETDPLHQLEPILELSVASDDEGEPEIWYAYDVPHTDYLRICTSLSPIH